MTLRFFPFQTMLVAGMAVAVIPAFALSPDQQGKQITPAQESPYQGSVVEEIVVRVNDQVINKSDYARAQQELENEARQQSWSQQQLLEQKRDLLRSLIDKQLLLSKGKELGITGETETVKRLDEYRKQNHLDSLEALQKTAESQGVSYEDFKQQIKDNVVTSEVIRNEVGRHVYESISSADVRHYYDQHQSEFDKPEQIRLSEILIPTENPDDATQVATAEKKANDVEAKLKAGGDFATVAKTDSGGSTAAQDGDLGDYKRGQLAKVLEDATFSLKPGEYTQPIRTKQGFVILKVTDHTAGGVQPFDAVQAQVQDQLAYSKMEPEMRRYLTRLREEAYLDIKPGYVDSGASANEQKGNLLYSSYVPPSKKKKKVQRTRFRERGRNAGKVAPVTESASAPEVPAGVPTLADVPQNGSQTSAATAPASPTANAPANPAKQTPQVASAKTYTQKPGKKEKIRYGQAPRETLPAAQAKSEDAGANAQPEPTQEAANNIPNGVQAFNPDGTPVGPQDEKPKEKTRFTARAKLPKTKKVKQSDPFAPPTETTDEVATRQTQSTPLGLNGDTLKPRKGPNPAKLGPKRRISDEKKSPQQPADSSQQNVQPATTDSSQAPQSPANSTPATPQPQQ